MIPPSDKAELVIDLGAGKKLYSGEVIQDRF